ncbi:MAG: transglycosylase domain-containing protein, partial [Gammaproteobacteria bacterium]|nr:transglycosylase domain-containing protein [Gammaproteobacteria bacterium]
MQRIISRLLWTSLSLLLTLVIILGAVYLYIEVQLPNVTVLKDVHMQVPLRIYTRGGKLIAQYGAKRRMPVTLSQIPKPLIQAVLATEDARYYEHPGVDVISILRAARAVLKSGRKVQGASTITMQVARNFFLSREKTYTRKIKEILLALKIDRELSKDKVLELYLNKVYFGHRAYGVAAAASVYYGKTLTQLSLAQMAMIAGLPQAPSRNNPLNRPKAALKRRNHVLRRMYEVGFIDKSTYLKAKSAPVTARYHGQRVAVYAPYFAEMVRQVMLAQYGSKVYEMGLQVYTTLNPKLQQ